MATYDPSKDKKLKEWKNEKTGLLISINQYSNGDPKLQIGPRVLKKQDGSEGKPLKAGRLSCEDIIWFYDIIDEVKNEILSLVRPQE